MDPEVVVPTSSVSWHQSSSGWTWSASTDKACGGELNWCFAGKGDLLGCRLKEHQMKSISSWLSKISGRLKQSSRSELCEGLQSLGLRAEVAERGRPEERITSSERSVGVIDIHDSPIAWMNIVHMSWWEVMNMRDDDGRAPYYYECGIPDPNLDPQFPDLGIECSLIKQKGRVVDLEWRQCGAQHLGLEIVDRLTRDVALRRSRSVVRPLVSSEVAVMGTRCED